MFTYNLEHEDGTPADPPTLRTAVSAWSPGDSIPLGGRTLRVVETRLAAPDEDEVLVVETGDTPPTLQVRVGSS